ncbi:hypothetical protein [Brevundimonas sp.]|jgi:hypothetical protein|uniref:hypothetical protein n=1 Tax=Brevundimonas sp. TaxID=1871086 RepID=UPI00378330E6
MAVISIKNKIKSGSLLVGNAYYVPPSFESIESISGTGSSGTITFTSIPSTYTHLQIRYLAKTSRAAVNDYAKLQINGDTTTSNYRSHSLNGGGSTAYSETHANAIEIGGFPGNTNANMFGIGVIDILDYANTSKYKTIRALSGFDQNSASTGAAWIGLDSGLWMSTTAINSISIIAGTGPNFSSASRFALYGIKG